ncbi:MAG: endonuclease MutS2 [Christensenellales bacterium]
MQERSLRVLEFNKIKGILVEYAVSSMGREICEGLVPSKSLKEIQKMLEETEETNVLLTRLGYNPVPAFEDITVQLKKAEIGSTLSPKDLLLCAECMRAARSLRQSLVKEKDEGAAISIIGQMASRLTTMREIESEITMAVISETELADGASPALSDIRRKIRRANERIKEKLNSYLHSQATQKYLQENVITIRNGRYVLPVKQEYRQNVPGLIHDQSATGSTLFIEPMAVVEMGNDIKQLSSQENAEIERILSSLTAKIAPYADALAGNLQIMARIDFAFAKGALSKNLRGTMPKMNDAGFLSIKRGRHPLINPQEVVPISLWIGKDFTTLVVTGPNTGGKTVTLKTVGLFALMAQAGLHVPADFGTELCVFDQIFADIGDEQSIEQSLSTFSSHMTNIVSILENLTEKSLVLFDELGAGTDPTEGASLAQAILDVLLKRNIITLATTHYSELKAYALTTSGVQNASVEFDVETLRPTYRLSIGIPGKSNAFDISKRLGLSQGIIDQAKERLSQEQIRFEDVISNAEYHRQVAEQERKLAEEARIEITRLQDEIEIRREKLENQREIILKKAREEARRILYSAKDQSERIIGELKKTAHEQAVASREANKAKQELDSMLSEYGEKIEAGALERLSSPPKSVSPGDSVHIISIGAQGTVLSRPDEKGQVQVQAGIMKINVPLKNLRLANKEKQEKGAIRRNIDMSTRHVPLELDVRGQLLEEAVENVDKYLDDAYLASRKEVSVIHGKGTGALRAGLQEHLKRHPHVESFRGGKFGEGEGGVTVIKLK